VRFARPQPYEEIDHTGDVGVVVRGATAEEALARLVLAFTEIVTGGGSIEATGEHRIEVEPSDRATMAIDVLRECLYELDISRMVAVACDVRRFDPATGGEVVLDVGLYDPEALTEGVELKAVTFHAARFEEDNGGWIAQIVFDI
jgi:SHS2 domain-containing protein